MKLHALCAAALLLLFTSAAASADEIPLPSYVPYTVAKAWDKARNDWRKDSLFVGAVYSRPNSKLPFDYEITFHSPPRQETFIYRNGVGDPAPKGAPYGNFAPLLTERFIDLPQAVEQAKLAGLKGDILKAEIIPWGPFHHTTTLQIWRLTSDGNAGKTFYVDAMTGVVYDQEHPNAQEVMRSHVIFGNALSMDEQVLMQAMRQYNEKKK